MKPIYTIALTAALFLTSLPSAWAVEMELFFLPHRPAVKVADEVEKIASGFKEVDVTRYSFDDEASHELVQKYAITGHLPVAIFIDGKNQFMVNGAPMNFQNFPKSEPFIPTFGGEWDYADLKAILSELTQ